MQSLSTEKESHLPVELLKELLRYEYETGLFYWINSAQKRRVAQPAGCKRKDGYVVIQINGKPYYSHRLVWLYVFGTFPQDCFKPYIDHINGNRSDNRVENLKVSSNADNCKNKQILSNNTSNVNGVSRVGIPSSSKKTPKVNYYWTATWCNENGKLRQKYFNIEKMGENGAKQSAIEHRAEQIRLLEVNFDIVYSQRHGT